ncbi:MAG: zinc-binding alcohol dehydrogenase family protein [Acidobacteria bacterium]|nr:zinc-binding alcohol dehydrogenase family protein [Acidobacteriota bacterium]NIM63371.1 zinc-binding alcohol dehydrogenase family protein [Acidobacteriota bacterium]NIO60080.1 zinc-binding alcohol dehydrogenase family protein [Acidobacteriota bacterium]NIQ31488.1 zinc-binding alcohol dehydrogenase family protein [Acidobacteriota bacterium]NIQ86263.1 zinc-binding alcohol dehydrogenase family protein [Acidobacteriota bacterium]
MAPDSLDLVDYPEPEPSAREIRVRVEACAVCRTDLHLIEGDIDPGKLPVVPGHMIVGTVEQTGFEARRFQLGDRVGIAWLRHTCGRCDDCRSGAENLCRGSEYTGCHADGGYADSCVVDESYAYALDDAWSALETAPLLCSGIIGYRALQRAALAPGGSVGLFGFGSSAAMVARLARHRGHPFFAFSRGEAHLEEAKRIGAAWAGHADDHPGEPLDAAIVFAPAGPVVPPALRAVRPGGRVVLAGIHMSEIPALDYERHLFHEKILTSVEANTRADGVAFLEEACAAGIRPKVQVFPLERANEALAGLKAGELDGTAVLDCG